VNWSSAMAAQPLSQRVARATGEGWGCLFMRVHLTLKRCQHKFWWGCRP